MLLILFKCIFMYKLERLVTHSLGGFTATVELVEHVVVGEGVEVGV